MYTNNNHGEFHSTYVSFERLDGAIDNPYDNALLYHDYYNETNKHLDPITRANEAMALFAIRKAEESARHGSAETDAERENQSGKQNLPAMKKLWVRLRGIYESLVSRA